MLVAIVSRALVAAVEVPMLKLLETVVVERVETPCTVRYPVARIFVDDTEASDDCPEMLSVAP